MTANTHSNAICFMFAGYLAAMLFPNSVLVATENWQQEGAVEVRSVEEIIAKWKPDQHLYLKGDLGISKPRLAKLEQWLDTNGSHWTIVLMRQAGDETYHALDQRTFHGMDAVEYALGHGLANRTDFGGLVHPETGETDGAVFVLFLVERKFSYYGSDLQDRRGLGESKWIGGLDRDAVRAMRNGGRIVDAVKNTVNSINRRVAKKIQSERDAEERKIKAKERARLERFRELEFLSVRLKETSEQMFPRIEESSRQVRTEFPEAEDSKLAIPPTDSWKKDLSDLQKDLANINVDGQDPYQQSPMFRELKQKTNQLRGEINYYLDLYAAHRSFGEILSPVEQRLDLVADHPSGAAIESSDEAYRILDEARSGHARGEVAFVDRIQQVENLIEQGEQAIKLEQQRITAESERTRTVRRTLYIVASFLAAGLLGLLWYLNLRRRPALRRAHDAFDGSSKVVETELQHVELILQRADQIVGSKTAFAQRGFTGRTLDLGTQTLSNVQQIKDMGKEAKGVIETAYKMLHPSNPIAEAANMVSTARYDHCTRLLSGRPLRARSGGKSTNESPTQKGGSWVTFGEFFNQLRRVGEETTSQLDTVDDSLTKLGPKIEHVQSQLDAALEIEQELADASRLDRYFRIPSFFDKLIPAAQQDCERANALAGHDPVQAFREFVPQADQRISDGLAIAKTIRYARSEVFPKLEEASGQLKSLGFDTRWIEQKVLRLGDRADQLMIDATTRDLNEELRQFDGDVTRLGLRTRRSVELANEISQVVSPALDRVGKEIINARRSICEQLNLDESNVLHEVDYDPDVELNHAREQLQSARAALDYGGVESAMESLEVLEIEKTIASQLVASSLSAVNDFFDEHQSLIGREEVLVKAVPQIQELIEERRSNYAESALIFHPNDESDDGDLPAEPADTIVSRMAKSVEFVKQANNAAAQAQESHSAGRVLQSANLLELSQQELDIASEMFEQIKEHCIWLDNQARENSCEIERRLNAVNTIKNSVEDLRTQTESRQTFEALDSATVQLHSHLGKEAPNNRDPFMDQQRLKSLAMKTESLMALIGADWRAHAAATRAVDGAQSELEAARQSTVRSRADQIPDSQTIKQCQTAVSALEKELDATTARLKNPHDVWQGVAEQADRILAELGIVDGQLRRELALAKDAVRELRSASSQVFKAATWKGSYGIKVVENPGSEQLDHARRSLSEGEYLASIEHSRSAEFQAKRAIDIARSQVREKKQEIARIAAEARRRRQASSFAGFTNGSSIGSSFGSSSRSSSLGSSSRSSRSRSSTRSSGGGSGFRRSGW